MCLITNKKPQVATEDITVYKILRSDFSSLYQGFQYELNVPEHTDITQARDGFFNAFCCIDLCYLESNFIDWTLEVDCGHLQVYEEGFHSISTTIIEEFLRCEPLVTEIIVECVIPKGATYIEDFVGFIVSNQITILKEVSKDDVITSET